jgi:cephalosporin hydroxylase
MSDDQFVIKGNALITVTPEGSREVDLYSPDGFKLLSGLWVKSGWQQRISYELTWMGIPIIQLPEDILMMQELIWALRPDVIVETGTAHGGTAVFYASILELLGKGHVVSIDIEIRESNRLAIQAHPMSKRISLIEGSSADERVVAQVRRLIQPRDRVLVALDSNHTYAHVREELERYSQVVTPGSYLIVFDGVMEILTDAPSGSPTWISDSPASAIRDFLSTHPEFKIDPLYNRLTVTYCPRGFLKRLDENVDR